MSNKSRAKRAPQRADDPSTAVTVAYIHDGRSVDYSWHVSLTRLVAYDLATHGRVWRGGYVAMRAGTDGLAHARNTAVRDFLNTRDADWLFWVDTDMGFGPDTVDRLMEVADPVERPIVGAMCFAQREIDDDGMGGWRPVAWPTVMDWTVVGEKAGFATRWDYPRDTVTRCQGTGSACILIHRSVFERIRDAAQAELAAAGRSDAQWTGWYSRVINPSSGELVGEDLSFCMRLMKLDIPLFVHTGVQTTHSKSIWLGEQDYWRQRAFNPPPKGAVPPADEKTAVIVPTLNRPQNAMPFMESLRRSTEMATAYAVVDSTDEASIRAWGDAGAQVIVGDEVTFAKKVNLGYAQTTEPWLFLVGDDVQFQPGWLDEAQEVARQTGANVVGTNDLGNPRVMRGEHANHMLIRRSYVDEVGASWDGPGVVCHPYHHWFVDDEIVAAAKQRGTFAPCLDAIVEHHHPYFGKGEMDDTYRLGEENVDADRETFLKRLEAHR